MSKAQDSMEERIRTFQSAGNSHSVDRLLSLMAPAISWSDFGWGKIDMDRAAVAEFFKEAFATTRDLKMETRAINGTNEFTAWEWDLTFKTTTKDDERGLEEGQEARLRYVSLFHWVEEDGSWKIQKATEYGSFVKQPETS